VGPSVGDGVGGGVCEGNGVTVAAEGDTVGVPSDALSHAWRKIKRNRSVKEELIFMSYVPVWDKILL
jgi:hypothetical protein